ncbi:MAG: hypothetical protein RR806_05630 [Oscillospiraceae bacterium]
MIYKKISILWGKKVLDTNDKTTINDVPNRLKEEIAAYVAENSNIK